MSDIPPISELRKSAEYRYWFTERLYISMGERPGEATPDELREARIAADEHVVRLAMQNSKKSF